MGPTERFPDDSYTITGTSSLTFAVAAGVVVKSLNVSGSTGIILTNGAKFDFNGTVSEPAVFTSLKDDSIGGDTNDSSATSPGNNDWTGSKLINSLVQVNLILNMLEFLMQIQRLMLLEVLQVLCSLTIQLLVYF